MINLIILGQATQTNYPLYILWAVQIAKSENFHSVIMEGDAKVCFDALNGDLENRSWAIASQCSDMIELSKEFVSCNFCQIKRDANFVAHSLAKSHKKHDLTNFSIPTWTDPVPESQDI